MSIVTAANLGKSFGADEIFRDISVEIPHGARIALVGSNGAGKTTLLNVLIKADEPSAGNVFHAKGLTVGHLPQNPVFDSYSTLWDEMLSVFSDLQRRELELAALAQRMADPDVPDADAIVTRYGVLQEAFEHAGGYMFETRIKQTLTGLGFDAGDYQQPLHTLSGGQKTRALLAKLLLESPDLLALDEPTNHLDIQAVEWLENFLNAWHGAVLVVSHDRYFMDKVATVIWELDWGRLESYRGNYTAYIRQREDRQAAHWIEYEAQQEKIAKEEEYIRRNMAGQNTRQAKGRLKRLERLKRDDLIARPQFARQFRFKLAASLRSGDKVLTTRELAVGYPDAPDPLLTVPDLTLYRGEAAALIGPNGVGKSTLLKTLLGILSPKHGTAIVGASVQIGYFAQAHELLDPNLSVLDELLMVKPMQFSEARNYLGTFLFSGDDVFRPIHTLSGGERGRVALAKLALGGANFLLLDEPTNHLDIPAQEVLQAVLAQFAGTILLVSHDRYLVDALATQIWAAEPGAMRVFKGTYQEYLAAREAERIARSVKIETKPAAQAAQPAKSAKPNGKTSKPLSKWELERRTASLEQDIQALEQKLEQLSSDLDIASTAGQVDRVRALGEDYTLTQAALEAKLSEWETLYA
ncbi:MAG: ABC-F family ATP-binding cassette domain-containing protein [Aggregatilineales bacterium]